MKDWESAKILGSAFGDIHVPALGAGKIIHIGADLGEEFGDETTPPRAPARACACTLLPETNCQEGDWRWNNLAFENNTARFLPRNPEFMGCGTRQDAGGQVFVHSNMGLAGQIIINAANTAIPAGELWGGAVQIGADACEPIEISPSPSAPQWQSPRYNGLPAALGGGAAGLNPFHLHDTACQPPTAAPAADRTFFSSTLSHVPGVTPETIVLVFDGPVKPESDVALFISREDANGQPILTYNWAEYFDITFGPTVNGLHSRGIRLHGTNAAQLMTGTYHIRPNTAAGHRLLCANLLTSVLVPVGENFDLKIFIIRDCNGNLTPDDEESGADTDNNGILDECESPTCDPDFNCDGNVDGDDSACILDVIAGNPGCECQDPDFNRDGNVDQDDHAALVNVIAGGNCP